MATREQFLERVRQAVRAGNQAGTHSDIEPRGQIGYHGAGPDAIQRFRDEFTAAGGFPYLVADHAAAVNQLLNLVRGKGARRILLGHGPVIDSLPLASRLHEIGADMWTDDEGRQSLFDAELAITGADVLIAETGTIVVMAGPEEPRSLTLLPPVHIVVADHSQILPDLFDLFAGFETQRQDRSLPSCLTLITGPSKTGDIELRLVTGVHGPGEVHIVLLTGASGGALAGR